MLGTLSRGDEKCRRGLGSWAAFLHSIHLEGFVCVFNLGCAMQPCWDTGFLTRCQTWATAVKALNPYPEATRQLSPWSFILCNTVFTDALR